MACDVVSSPYHETSAFEEDWREAMGNGSDVNGLGLIADFNASCDNNTTAFHDNNASGSIDPQLLTNSSIASSEPAVDVFNQAFGSNEFAYPDFNRPTPANTPYFQTSIEAPSVPIVPIFASSPLRHQLHRRSVSEPPEGFPQHHHHHSQHLQPPHYMDSVPPVTFHRAGHYLGQPKSQHAARRPMKSLPKNKPSRSQPYTVKNNPNSTSSPVQQQARYNLRRTQTQPVHHMRSMPPTSAPQGPYMASPPPPMPPMPPIQGQAYTTSRVCTPAPSPGHSPFAASPMAIDPMLRTATPEKKVVSIPIDELKSIITEAVRKAVEGIQAAKKEESISSQAADAEVGAYARDEDEIVVASVEERGEFQDAEFEDASMEF